MSAVNRNLLFQSKDQSILGGGLSVQHCSPWRDITSEPGSAAPEADTSDTTPSLASFRMDLFDSQASATPLASLAVSEKLMEQAATARVQDSRKAEESRSEHLGEGKCSERARLQTTGCILSGVGTPKSEFRVDRLCPRQEKHTACASQKSKSEIPTKEDDEGYFELRAFTRC